ncbi:MAG: hypothetical protein MJZ26_09275 [Fibrobacter sp.]|nr:hypothetical protein [Fibrobacter sp.]
MKYLVKEIEEKGKEPQTLATFTNQKDSTNATAWADGYAFGFATYRHSLQKPMIQQIDGYQWWNHANGYKLWVEDENGKLVCRENDNL